MLHSWMGPHLHLEAPATESVCLEKLLCFCQAIFRLKGAGARVEEADDALAAIDGMLTASGCALHTCKASR